MAVSLMTGRGGGRSVASPPFFFPLSFYLIIYFFNNIKKAKSFKINPLETTFAPSSELEQICTRMYFVKRQFTWPKIHSGRHPGYKNKQENKRGGIDFGLRILEHFILGGCHAQ